MDSPSYWQGHLIGAGSTLVTKNHLRSRPQPGIGTEVTAAVLHLAAASLHRWPPPTRPGGASPALPPSNGNAGLSVGWHPAPLSESQLILLCSASVLPTALKQVPTLSYTVTCFAHPRFSHSALHTGGARGQPQLLGMVPIKEEEE